MTSTPGGLLAVHAHPDDETLATGALLATWAAAGAPVTVVTCTRGERGEVIPPELRHLEGDGERLADHRERELAAALAVLGVTDHAFLDTLPTTAAAAAPSQPDPAAPPRARRDRYEDSGMVWVGAGRAGSSGQVPPHAFVGAPLDEAAGRLATLLRERRPAVVASYDPEGGYGHPDHVRAHEVTMRAVDLARGDGWEPAVLWRRAGRAALAAAQRALAGDAVRAALGSAYDQFTLPSDQLPALAVADDLVDLAVDARAVRERVLSALVAHETQVQAVRAVDGEPALVGCYALSNGVLAPLLAGEAYALVAGPAPVLPAGVRRLP